VSLEVPVWIEAVPGDDPILMSARQYRTLIDAVYRSEGVVGSTELVVSARAAGANMSIDISPGLAIIQGDSVAAQGKYAVRSTAVENRAVATAPTTGSRTDLVVLQLFDKQADGGTLYGWDIQVLTGTTTAPPSSVILGRVTVSAGNASIAAGNITLTGRQWATYHRAPAPVEVAQGAAVAGMTTPVNVPVDFASGVFAPLTVTYPPSGKVFVTITGNIQNEATTTATVWLGWRISAGAGTTANGDNTLNVTAIGTAGSRLFGSRRVLLTGTSGTSVTIQPQWQISSGSTDVNVTFVRGSILTAEPV
jgi:hypothetical protein